MSDSIKPPTEQLSEHQSGNQAQCPMSPEEILDCEQAMQEASDGKLDYLLEGTQWDPKNRQ